MVGQAFQGGWESLHFVMVSLEISDCIHCVALPPLGQLPSLEFLDVGGLELLETIGPEFYGSSLKPFPSLKSLEISGMSNWKDWLPIKSGEFPFPLLETLRLRQCLELRGHLPSHLSSINRISITDCDNLLETSPSLHWLSSIKEMNIVSSMSPERSEWSLLESDSPCQLQSVSMEGGDKLVCLPKMIQSSNCLRDLSLRSFPSLTTFPANSLPTSLSYLRIDGCENLAFLPVETWSNYTSLVALSLINSCNSLTSFPLDGFPVLQDLTIIDCSNLESISLPGSSSLHPLSLQSLVVIDCKTLRSLPQRMDTLTALKRLCLYNLPKLELSFCGGAWLPSKLSSIDIISLPPLALTNLGIQDLTALSYLGVGGDDNVNTLLKERLLPIGLVSLTICSLSKMTSLEGNGLRRLTSLEELEFWDCPRLEPFPKRTFPSSLKVLRITECRVVEARYESERGEHWSNIAHIPVIQINHKVRIL